MVQIKKSSKEELTHSNSFGRVNASFAKFVVDFLAMSLLFDSFFITMHKLHLLHGLVGI
jgi:hypothetical protein